MKLEPKNTTHPDYGCGCEADERILLEQADAPEPQEGTCSCLGPKEGIVQIGHC